MSRRICTTEPATCLILLGIVCNTAQRRFEVPESELENFDALLINALDGGWISPINLEKLAGKCTSMSVAVLTASLYTYHLHRKIAQYQRASHSLQESPSQPAASYAPRWNYG